MPSIRIVGDPTKRSSAASDCVSISRTTTVLGSTATPASPRAARQALWDVRGSRPRTEVRHAFLQATARTVPGRGAERARLRRRSGSACSRSSTLIARRPGAHAASRWWERNSTRCCGRADTRAHDRFRRVEAGVCPVPEVASPPPRRAALRSGLQSPPTAVRYVSRRRPPSSSGQDLREPTPSR